MREEQLLRLAIFDRFGGKKKKYTHKRAKHQKVRPNRKYKEIDTHSPPFSLVGCHKPVQQAWVSHGHGYLRVWRKTRRYGKNPWYVCATSHKPPAGGRKIPRTDPTNEKWYLYHSGAEGKAREGFPKGLLRNEGNNVVFFPSLPTP